MLSNVMLGSPVILSNVMLGSSVMLSNDMLGSPVMLSFIYATCMLGSPVSC